MPALTAPAQVGPIDQSFTLSAGVNPLATLYPASPSAGVYPTAGIGAAGTNPNRTFLMFQAPKTNPVAYSFTNTSPSDPASTVSTGTFILAAGAVSPNWGGVVPKGPVYFNGGSAANGTMMTLVEC